MKKKTNNANSSNRDSHYLSRLGNTVVPNRGIFSFQYFVDQRKNKRKKKLREKRGGIEQVVKRDRRLSSAPRRSMKWGEKESVDGPVGKIRQEEGILYRGKR